MALCICWGKGIPTINRKSHITGCKKKAKEQNLENNWTNPNPISQSEKGLLRSFPHHNLCSPVHLWENGDASLSTGWCGQDSGQQRKRLTFIFFWCSFCSFSLSLTRCFGCSPRECGGMCGEMGIGSHSQQGKQWHRFKSRTTLRWKIV